MKKQWCLFKRNLLSVTNSKGYPEGTLGYIQNNKLYTSDGYYYIPFVESCTIPLMETSLLLLNIYDDSPILKLL